MSGNTRLSVDHRLVIRSGFMQTTQSMDDEVLRDVMPLTLQPITRMLHL